MRSRSWKSFFRQPRRKSLIDSYDREPTAVAKSRGPRTRSLHLEPLEERRLLDATGPLALSSWYSSEVASSSDQLVEAHLVGAQVFRVYPSIDGGPHHRH